MDLSMTLHCFKLCFDVWGSL